MYGDLSICGCGNPEDAYTLVRDLLALTPFYEGENWHRAVALIGTPGAVHLVISALGHAGLVEHDRSGRMTETFKDVGDFLRAQIHVDKRVALDALADWVEGEDGDEMAGQPDSIRVGAHLVFWNPKRVLAECDAKLRLVELHRSNDEGSCITCMEPIAPCDTLQVLTLPYADRYGFLSEWRP